MVPEINLSKIHIYGCRTNSKISINQDYLFSALLQIPDIYIYTSKPSVHRNGATARGSIILRVTKIGATYKIFSV